MEGPFTITSMGLKNMYIVHLTRLMVMESNQSVRNFTGLSCKIRRSLLFNLMSLSRYVECSTVQHVLALNGIKYLSMHEYIIKQRNCECPTTEYNMALNA